MTVVSRVSTGELMAMLVSRELMTGIEGPSLQGVHNCCLDGLHWAVHDYGIESPREVHMVRYDFRCPQGFEEIFVDGILELVAC